ncbi:MAG: flippase-like domain-containing protein, partial [Clostridia bacterium]|nr:flippase-like domain-containing protein [Clostridia bacterium]
MGTLKKIRSRIPWGLVFNIFIVGLTIFLIVFFIFSKDGFIDLLNSGVKINVLWLLFAVFMHLSNIAIDATIIYLFVKESTPDFSLKNAIVVSMVGQFYCAITPSASGGQPMQILSMTRMGVSGANGTAALIQKFLVWQFTLTAYSVFAMVAKFSMFVGSLDYAMWVLTAIGFTGQILTIVVLLLASFNKSFTSKLIGGIFRFLGKIHLMKNVDQRIVSLNKTLNSFHECNKTLNKNKALVVKVYVLTFIQLTILFLVPFCIAMSFGVGEKNGNVNMLDMLCAQSYVSMVSGLVPLPGGSGAAEYCFSQFFGSFFDAQMIKSAILIWRTITYYGTIMVSLPFAAVRKKKNAAPIDDSADNNDNN